MTQTYARVEGGERIYMPVPFVKGKKISLIGAVSIHSVEAAWYGEWNTNGEIFIKFIETQLVPKLSRKNVIIMDNIQFHKSQMVIKAIKKTGAKIMFLPPYSPEFSPIENMWSKIKLVLRRLAPRSIKAFSKAISQAFSEVKATDLLGWFNHCGYSA